MILTFGDVSFDWHWFDFGRAAPDARPRIEPVALHGGAWYIDNFVRMLLGPDKNGCIYTYRRFPTARLRACDARDIGHTLTDYQRMPMEGRRRSGLDTNTNAESDAGYVFRVARDRRFFAVETPGRRPKLVGCPLDSLVGPRGRERELEKKTRVCWSNTSGTDERNIIRSALAVPRPYPSDVRQQIIVIQDSGDGFSTEPTNWIQILPARSSRQKSIVDQDSIKAIIICLNDVRALNKNLLWKHLLAEGYGERTVVILGADDLRHAGVNVSKSVSWERTAFDIVSQLRTNDVLRTLARVGHLVIRFGISGVVHHIGARTKLLP